MSDQQILSIEFQSEDGRSCNAIGGGRTVTAAIDYAREACPGDAEWDVVRWEDLYGD